MQLKPLFESPLEPLVEQIGVTHTNPLLEDHAIESTDSWIELFNCMRFGCSEKLAFLSVVVAWYSSMVAPFSRIFNTYI